MEDSIYLTKVEVCSLIKLSPAQLDRLEAAGNFPRRFNLTGATRGKVVWLQSEVHDWMLARSRRILKPPSDSLESIFAKLDILGG